MYVAISWYWYMHTKRLKYVSQLGRTALMWACIKGHYATALALILWGAKLDLQDQVTIYAMQCWKCKSIWYPSSGNRLQDGSTALMKAIANNRVETVKLLLLCGASRSLRNQVSLVGTWVRGLLHLLISILGYVAAMFQKGLTAADLAITEDARKLVTIDGKNSSIRSRWIVLHAKICTALFTSMHEWRRVAMGAGIHQASCCPWLYPCLGTLRWVH